MSEEKPFITNKEMDEIASKLSDQFGLIATESGLKIFIARETETVFTLSQFADMVEKIEEKYEKEPFWSEIKGFVVESHCASESCWGPHREWVNWPLLFREKPDLVLKIWKGDNE